MIIYKCDICGAEYNKQEYLHMMPKKIKGIIIRPLVCDRCVSDYDKFIKAFRKKALNQKGD